MMMKIPNGDQVSRVNKYVKMRMGGQALLDKMSAWGHIRTI